MKGDIVTAHSMPPIIINRIAEGIKVKIVSNISIEIPLKKMSKDIYCFGFGNLLTDKKPSCNIFMSMLMRAIKMSPEWLEIKLGKNQLLALTYIDMDTSLKKVEVWMDIIEILGIKGGKRAKHK